MICRAVTLADVQLVGVRDRARDILFRLRDCCRRVSALCQTSGYRGGQRTARAVGVFGIHARRGKFLPAVLGIQHVYRGAVAV